MMSAIETLLGSDHNELDELLDSVLRSLEEEDAATAFSRLDLFWARLAMHIRAEHLHLFPAVLKTCEADPSDDYSDIPETLDHLRDDHNFFMQELATTIKSMRAISAENAQAVIRDARRRLEIVRDRLVQHNTVEEARIYPLRKSSPSTDDESLLRSLARELDNLPPRFRN